MPITVRLDPSRRLRHAVASGVVTDSDVLDGYGSVLASPGYDPALDMIFDASGIDRVEVSTATVKEMAELARRTDRALAAGVRPRVAIVAPTDATFGLARMYQAYRESQQSPKQYLVVRTMAEARLWLGLPDGGENRAMYRLVPVQFNDPFGVRWSVVPRLVVGTRDALPEGFEFMSEAGERRFLRWDPRDFFSPREVGPDQWRALLRASTVET